MKLTPAQRRGWTLIFILLAVIMCLTLIIRHADRPMPAPPPAIIQDTITADSAIAEPADTIVLHKSKSAAKRHKRSANRQGEKHPAKNYGTRELMKDTINTVY